MDMSTIWGRVSLNSGRKRKGVKTMNKTNTSEYVVDIHQRATEYGVCNKAEAASLAARDVQALEETGRLLDEAD